MGYNYYSDNTSVLFTAKERYFFSFVYGKTQHEVEFSNRVNSTYKNRNISVIGYDDNFPYCWGYLHNIVNRESDLNRWDNLKLLDFWDWCDNTLNALSALVCGVKLNFTFEINRYNMYLYHKNRVFRQCFNKYLCVILDTSNPWNVWKSVDLPPFFSSMNLPTSYFYNYQYRAFHKEHSILISRNIISSIINNYIYNFYTDYIYSGNSRFDLSCLGKKVSSEKLSLYLHPYCGAKYDGEGSFIQEKAILRDGIFQSVVSNKKYADALNICISGNADYDNSDRLDHQMIRCKISRGEHRLHNEAVVFEMFHNINYDINNNVINAVLQYYEYGKEKRYLAQISFNVDLFFDRLTSIGGYRWVDNVFCTESYLDNGNLFIVHN